MIGREKLKEQFKKKDNLRNSSPLKINCVLNSKKVLLIEQDFFD